MARWLFTSRRSASLTLSRILREEVGPCSTATETSDLHIGLSNVDPSTKGGRDERQGHLTGGNLPDVDMHVWEDRIPVTLSPGQVWCVRPECPWTFEGGNDDMWTEFLNHMRTAHTVGVRDA